MMIIYGHVEEMNADNYVTEARKAAQSLKKHHLQTFQKYQLVMFIHYLKITKEKYLRVVLINEENVDWVISIILKSYQVSFSIHLQTLFILFVDMVKVYFLIQKGMYTLLGIMSMVNLVLVTICIRMNCPRYQKYHLLR